MLAHQLWNQLTPSKVKQHKNGKTYRFQFQFEIGFDPSLRFSFEVNPTLYWPSFRQKFGETLHTHNSFLVVVGTFPSKMELIQPATDHLAAYFGCTFHIFTLPKLVLARKIVVNGYDSSSRTIIALYLHVITLTVKHIIFNMVKYLSR